MAQDNVEIVCRGWRAFEGGDVARAFEAIGPGFVASRVPPMPDVIAYHGADGLLQMLVDWTADFSDFKLTAEQFTALDATHVMVRIHQRAVGAKSGAPIEADFWMVHTMSDGKTIRLDIYGSSAQALRAVRQE